MTIGSSYSRAFAAALSLLLLSGCVQEQKTAFARGEGAEKEEQMPESPAGNQAGFSLGTGEGALRVAVGGAAHVFSEADEIYFKSAIYHPTIGETGTANLDIPEATSGEYLMFLFPGGSRFWYSVPEEAPLSGLIIPYSQFYGSTVELLSQYPMIGRHSGTAGSLEFKEILSAVGITVKGDFNAASVHLQNKSARQLVSRNLAGMASLNEDGEFVLTEGVNFVNLNCTDGGSGVPVTSAGKTFYLLLAPGNYDEGLTLTVTGMDHKGQVFDVAPFEVAPGEVKTIETAFSYAPPVDLLFFEHFDNFVWGGNVQGNEAVASYAPDASADPNETPMARTGYEQAFTRVGTVTPGSAFIQTNWASVSGWTVGQRPSVSAEYVKSRNIGDITYMFRCQEFQGCLSVGGADEMRGGYTPLGTGPVKLADGEIYYSLRISFDVCLRYGTKDRFCSQLSGSGIASRLVIDGEEVPLDNTIGGNNTYTHSFQNVCSFGAGLIPGPKSAKYTEGWHHVEITLVQMNELSLLGLWGYDTSAVIDHGALIDNVEIRRVPVEPAAEKPLRVLVWNIQYGMWADQANDFRNFAEFIKKYDPDVCVFDEAKSYWADGVATHSGVSAGKYRLFKNNAASGPDATYNNITNSEWGALAAKWGHPYHAVAAYWFNDAKTNINMFPQVITSKYRITTVNRLHSVSVPDEPSASLTRGGGHFRITVDGKTVNIVTVHLWPFKYRNNNDQSKNDREGYDVQRRELKGALNATVAKYPDEENWLVMGDMNSVSPLDEDYLIEVQYGEYLNYGDKWTRTHRQVLQSPDRPSDGNQLNGPLNFGRPLFDMLREGDGSLYTGPGRMITSTGGNVRYDMMYGSESMRRRVDANSLSIRDSFSSIKSTAQYDPDDDEKQAKKPSDHLPVLVEFDMSK